MRRLLGILTTFFILFGVHTELSASHIVGGDFFYEDRGNNIYDITLKLYIDCENGKPGAISSDEFAIIAIFDAQTGKYESQFEIRRLSPKRLSKVQYKCVIPPQDVCVDGYTYSATRQIDPGLNGKILSFQRCCRNNTISNIVSPERTGSTYWVKIPGTNTVNSNSSAVFKELPPNYICTGAPLQFDHSAEDPDGDSLVYELFRPYHGGTYDLPRPNHSFDQGMFDLPPFKQLTWKSPYHTFNQMGGDPILTIDRFTGRLDVTPDKVGQYVIGIKVMEYRDGKLINETYRDYQFNVKKCEFDVISAFASPTYSCSDTVRFENKSFKAKHYLWNFGDPNTEADTSRETNPIYVYPKDGNYTVSLKAWNDACVDEYITTVKVRANIKLDLGPDMTFCDKVDRYLYSGIYDATKIEWNTGQFGSVIRAQDTGLYKVTVHYGQCNATDSLRIRTDPIVFALPTDTLFCEEEDVDVLFDVGITGLKYRWSPSPRDTFSTLQVNDTGIYWVRVRNKYCLKVDSVHVYTATKPKIGPYYFECNEFNKQMDGGYGKDATYLWQDGSTDRYFNVTSAGKYWVQVTQEQCVNSDTVLVENPRIEIDLGPDEHFCDIVDRRLYGPSSMKIYKWSTGENTPSILASEAGTYRLEVEDTNGCFKEDSVYLSMTESPSIEIGDDTSICARMKIDFSPIEDFAKYIWSNGKETKSISVEEAGGYSLTVVDEYGCTGTDSVYVTVDHEALPNELFIANAFSPNEDELNERFPFSFEIDQPDYRTRVFNRWGEKVFDSKEDGPSWDATFKGENVTPDAYMYLVEYRGCDGNFRRKSGTVTVLR